MATVERAPRRPSPDRRDGAWRGYAFGLELEAPRALPCVPEASSSPGRRRTLVEDVTASELDRAWPAREAEAVVDRRFADGRAMMRIDRHPELGYRIWAPGYGRYLVSPQGQRIQVALPQRTWRWQRLFFAQVLPLGAALQGLEPFHASAVEFGGRAVAFVASAGTGKTSVAAHLVAAGFPLVTDDVLALEPRARGVLAHPGCGLVNLDEAEACSMDAPGRRRMGRLLGRTEKLHLATEVAEHAVPLALVYFLRRRGAGRRPAIIEDDQPVRSLLAASFLTYLRAPDRLMNHLEACARVAESARTFRVELPQGSLARTVARDVEAHARGLLG